MLAQVSQGSFEEVKTWASGMIFDFGIRYNTGFRSIQIGASVQNFGPNVTYAIQSSPVPLLFRWGVAADLIGKDALLSTDEENRLGLAFDLYQPNDYGQQEHLGVEYELPGNVCIEGRLQIQLRLRRSHPRRWNQTNSRVGALVIRLQLWFYRTVSRERSTYQPRSGNQMKRSSQTFLFIVMVLLCVLSAPGVRAQGFGQPLTIQGLDHFTPQSAASRGAGGIIVGLQNDVSMMFTDPASLQSLQGFQVSIGDHQVSSSELQTQQYSPLKILFELQSSDGRVNRLYQQSDV